MAMQPPHTGSEHSTKARFSHIGVCVSDLVRAVDFYTNVFGFAAGQLIGGQPNPRIDSPDNIVLGINEELTVSSQFLRLDNQVIELLYFRKPVASGPSLARPMNQLGLTHLSLNVSDPDAVCRDVEIWGGKVLYETKAHFAFGENKGFLMFATDPDGTRVELMCFPEDINVRDF